MASQPITECSVCGHISHWVRDGLGGEDFLSPCTSRTGTGGRCDCGGLPVSRPGPCRHPGISDQVIRDYSTPEVQSWGQSLRCDDCGEYIFPHETVDDELGWIIEAVIGEPYGAGR